MRPPGINYGAVWPRFSICVLLLLSACSEMQVQQPTIELHQVHQSGAQRISFSPSGDRLASGGLTGDVRIWSVTDGEPLQVLPGHDSSVRGLGWLDADHLVSAGKGGELTIWNLPDRKAQQSVQPGPLQDMALSKDRRWLLLAQGDRLLRLSSIDLSMQASMKLDSKILSVAIDATGDRVAASASDGSVWLLDASLQHRRALPQANSDAQGLRFSPDGRRLYGGSWFHVLVWGLADNSLEQRSTEHRGKVISVDPSPDGRYLLTLGRITDSSMRLVDADSNRVVRRFPAHALCGWQARFSPDGEYAASSSEDGSIRVYTLGGEYEPVYQQPDFWE